MFKLDGMDVKESARPASRATKSRHKSYGSGGDEQDGVQVVNWDQQAIKSAEGLSKNKDFRSAAVYAEVKLAEALNKRTLEKKLNGEDDTEGNPDMYRTAFCIHLLGELVGLSGPFGKVLHTIREEVCKAIYSEYYAAQKEDLIFEQQTFFSALEHVEAEKEELLEEKEQFRQILEERVEEIDKIHGNIKDLAKSLAQERQEKQELQEKLEKTESELKNRTGEFRLCVDDLKQARQALIRTSDDLKELRSRNTEKSKQLQSLTQEVAALRKELDSVAREKDQIQIATAGSASKKELDMAKQTIEELEAKVTKLSGADSIQAARSLTPRPDWNKLKPFQADQESQNVEPPPKTDGSTRSLAQEVVTRLKKSIGELDLAQRDLKHLRQRNRNALSLLNSDPDPSAFAATVLEQMQLSSKAAEGKASEEEKDVAQLLPSVLGALSELSQGSVTGSKKEHIFEPFGVDGNIPRFLRHTRKLTFTLPSKAETRALVSEIWSAKDEYDGLRTRSSTLMEYTFAHFLERFGSNTDMIAEEGYKLFLSLHCYSSDGDVLMFKRVLYGEISEECHFDFECLMAALMQEIQGTLKDQDQATIPKADLHSVLGSFFPHMDKTAVGQIKEALDLEQGGKDEVEYMLLFDAEVGNRGAFLDAVKRQYLQDVASYSGRLKAELAKVEQDDNGFAKLGDIKRIISSFDERKTLDDVYMYLARGAHLNSVADVKFYEDLGEEVEISEFVRNLSSKLVRPSEYYVMGAGGGAGDDSGGSGGGGTFMTEPELA